MEIIPFILFINQKEILLLSVASDSEVKTEPMQLPSSVQWTEREIENSLFPQELVYFVYR